MKKWIVGLFVLFVFIFVLSGCGKSSATIEKVNVHKMVNFSVVEKDSLITFTDASEISIFIDAFHNANRLPGVADVANPEYKVELGDESYFLWIRRDSGSIMHSNDTNALYTLSKSSAKKIYKLLNE